MIPNPNDPVNPINQPTPPSRQRRHPPPTVIPAKAGIQTPIDTRNPPPARRPPYPLVHPIPRQPNPSQRPPGGVDRRIAFRCIPSPANPTHPNPPSQPPPTLLIPPSQPPTVIPAKAGIQKLPANHPPTLPPYSSPSTPNPPSTGKLGTSTTYPASITSNCNISILFQAAAARSAKSPSANSRRSKSDTAA